MRSIIGGRSQKRKHGGLCQVQSSDDERLFRMLAIVRRTGIAKGCQSAFKHWPVGAQNTAKPGGHCAGLAQHRKTAKQIVQIGASAVTRV